ncbi:MAG: hypothetical protein Q8M29_11655 [Bacteroidota bacterium]|nr:hypothetical protein [Bacteroidota bacterium]
MKFVIVKYLFLLAALLLSVYVLLVKNSFTWTMFYGVALFSACYVLVAVIESFYSVKQKKASGKIFTYFTQGTMSKKAIRIGGFMIASGILLFSGMKVLLFGIVLFSVLLTEILNLWVKLKNKMYYVYFEEKAIVFNDDQVRRIFASHVSEIEYRYNIFYLTLKNDQLRMIDTERVGENERKEFIKEFIFWATTYQLAFTGEAKEKLELK